MSNYMLWNTITYLKNQKYYTEKLVYSYDIYTQVMQFQVFQTIVPKNK